jgi:fibronectin-binding autotransporter adhesin
MEFEKILKSNNIIRITGFLNQLKCKSVMKIFSKIVFIFLLIALSFETYAQRKVERLGRGVVAVNKGGGTVYISWRLLASDPEDISFNLYRIIGSGSAVKVNASPITLTTDFTDNSASTSETNTYFVRPVINTMEQENSGSFTLPAGSVANNYITLTLKPLAHYSVNHVYVGDLNGDGEYDYVVKRFPDDPANDVMIEAYLNSGTFLWRIDLGPNVEQGASSHNPFVLVHDFDCDGKAEVLVRTGEGAVFADGSKITDMNGDGITDYRTLPPVSLGYMVLGDNCPEYISMVDGLTGKEITRTDNIDRGPKANWTALWGDNYGHRMNMNHVGVAYLDGIHPSIISSRGEGSIMDIEAYDYSNKTITSRWTWSARTNTALPAGKTWRQFHDDWVAAGAKTSGIPSGYHWADFHNIRVVDLDGDGKDEISWGVNAMDDNGKPLYFAQNDVGHGDRFVIADIDPDRPGLETYAIQQVNSVLAVLYDAKTNERIKTWSTANPYDVSRGDVGDIDPQHKGMELWSYAHSGLLNCKGEQIAPAFPHPALSIWWDGDLQRENLDAAGKEGYNPIINKWDYNSNSEGRLFSLYNEGGAYSTQCPYSGRVPLYADIMGDWREEVVLTSSDSTELRIFSTSTPASRRLYCLMQNPEYRNCINLKAYLPSNEVDYYLGEGMSNPPLPPTITMKSQWKGGLSGNIWDINTTANWISNDVSSKYNDGDSIMFDINGTGNTSIKLSGTLAPAYVVVNSPVDYIFGGTGKITGSTKLIKSGKGALTIATNCDYSGVTKVDEGACYVDSTISNSPVSVNWHAIVGGKGKIVQQVTLTRGAIIAPGTTSSVGSLTFLSNLILPGENTCMFDITDDSTGLTKPGDKIVVTGNLIISDTTFFKIYKINGSVKSGFYPLISYTGTFTGSLKKISVSGLFGQKTVLKDSIHTIWLEVKASREAGKVIWSGNGKDWDLLTTPNWLYNGMNDIFAPNDSVIFNEIGSGQYLVNLTGDLPISNMTVETANNNYYFSGTGIIGGTGGITKSGNGILSITNTTNSYKGKTVINDGVFIIGGLNNAGLNSSIGASTSVAPSDIVFNNTKVQYLVGADTNTDRGVTFGGTQDTIEVGTSGKVLALGGVLAGTGKLVKAGAGTLYISGNTNTYTGGTVIKGGIVQINDPLATIGAIGSGSITIDGGTFTMGNNINMNGTVFNNNIIVPDGAIGYLNTDGRCDYKGTLAGNGTLNIYLPGTIGRTVFFGSWAGFTGKVNITGTMDSKTGYISQCRLYNGISSNVNASFNLGTNVTLIYKTNNNNYNTAETVSLGELTGVSGSFLDEENWVIGSKNTNFTFSGTISNYSLTKVGTGIFTIPVANTYSGYTNVNSGTLLVTNTTGSATGTGAVTVNSGGILQGTGIISGTVTIASGGSIAPGNAYGSLTVNNTVTMLVGSKYLTDVRKDNHGSDKLVATGTVTLNGSLIINETTGNAFAAGDSFKFISALAINGSFLDIYPNVPGSGLVWDTTMLRSNGVIKVALNSVTSAKGFKLTSYEIKIYPNPVNSTLSVVLPESSKQTTILIMSLNGKLIKSFITSQSTNEINVSDLPGGVYLVEIRSDKGAYTKHIVKQ